MYDDDRIPRGDLVLILTAITLVVVVVMGMAISMLKAPSNDQYIPNAIYAEKTVGLVSGREYPLQFGSRISGSGRSFTLSTGGTRGYIQPASSLSIAFNGKRHRSYILELPLSKTVFIQKSNVKETISIEIQGEQLVSREIDFHYIYFSSSKRPIEDTCLYKSLLNDGQLGDFLAKGGRVKSVKITLRPESYKKILG